MQVSDALAKRPEEPTLPSLVPHDTYPVIQKARPKRQSLWIWIALLFLAVAAGGGYYIWKQAHPPLPAGISMGNGRVEGGFRLGSLRILRLILVDAIADEAQKEGRDNGDFPLFHDGKASWVEEAVQC